MSSKPDLRTSRLREASEWLFRLQEDVPSNEQIIEWVEWCSADPENRRAFEQLLPGWQAMDAPNAGPTAAKLIEEADTYGDEALEVLSADVLPRLRARGRQDRWRNFGRRRWASLAAVAASLALVFTALLIWDGNRANTLQSVTDFTSTTGQVREARLPDGSHIDLGARSSVAVNFQGSQRHIELRDGEAFFTVKHDKSHPFIVETGALKVTAVGTAFNVRRAGQRVAITVQEGLVEVAEHASITQVPAGSQVVFDPAVSDAPDVRAVNPKSVDAWRNGQLEYLNEPLSAVVADLSRYDATPISIDEKLGQLSYTGTIELTSIDDWLRALPRIFPIEVKLGAEPEHRVTLVPRKGVNP